MRATWKYSRNWSRGSEVELIQAKMPETPLLGSWASGSGTAVELRPAMVRYFLSNPCASSCIFSTVFQLRPVFTTPIHLSNFSAILLVPKPFGVYM